MRIIAGTWRGKILAAPAGWATRPTAERLRQALFDMLMHNDWGGRAALTDGAVLDAYAGTGALGLEALSRGAARVVFMERDKLALQALRQNIAAVRAEGRCQVVPGDVLHPPAGQPCALVFLDPPYGEAISAPVAALAECGWIAPGSLIVAETARSDRPDLGNLLTERSHGASRVSIWRWSGMPGR